MRGAVACDLEHWVGGVGGPAGDLKAWGEFRQGPSWGQASWHPPPPPPPKIRQPPIHPLPTPHCPPSPCRYDREGQPSFASARLWDDGVIDPADTRRVLGLGLAAATNAPRQPNSTRYGVFRM